MTDDTLSLNEDKTEFLIIGTKRQLPKVSVVKIKVDQVVVTPVSSVSSPVVLVPGLILTKL